MDNQKHAILKKHLNDMEIWLEEENINRNSNLGKELLKQARELIIQHYEIEELKKINKILKAKVCVDKKEMEKKLNRIQFLTREFKKEINSISSMFKVEI
jgi:hypothetical protein|nr:MAG TPA: hypothetical protein [Caudoviricetes sp.]